MSFYTYSFFLSTISFVFYTIKYLASWPRYFLSSTRIFFHSTASLSSRRSCRLRLLPTPCWMKNLSVICIPVILWHSEKPLDQMPPLAFPLVNLVSFEHNSVLGILVFDVYQNFVGIISIIGQNRDTDHINMRQCIHRYSLRFGVPPPISTQGIDALCPDWSQGTNSHSLHLYLMQRWCK